ncbi:MAG: hypothetical protein RIQ81_2092 [Pseudomonadota bacterium]|jgi:membrane-bound lytic murein transglycosylase D
MLGLPRNRPALALAIMLPCLLAPLLGATVASSVVPVGIAADAALPRDSELEYFVEELERENAVALEKESVGEPAGFEASDDLPQKSRGDVVPPSKGEGKATSKRSNDQRSGAKELFPAQGLVGRKVKFWEMVFRDYPSTTMIIHDVDEPDRIVDLIDFKEAVRGRAGDPVAGRSERQRVAQRYVDRYELAIARFRQMGEAALQYGAIERRVWATYGSDESQREKLLAGDIHLRSQSGLADTFDEAARNAQNYLPYMEKVFAGQGLPIQLTRLPFVESMFNSAARSRVGASGMWQFMPQTARLYMRVDGRMVDERNSPWKATRAAAMLMQDNYEILRSWPLAVTAYNHGAAGLERAMREAGSDDINLILANYRSRSFGFASRNFYAEFLAAVNVYDSWKKKQKGKRAGENVAAEFVTLPRKASVAEILSASRLPEKRLAELNPCLLPAAFKNLRKKQLPSGFEIRLPRDHARKLRVAMGPGKARETISRR